MAVVFLKIYFLPESKKAAKAPKNQGNPCVFEVRKRVRKHFPIVEMSVEIIFRQQRYYAGNFNGEMTTGVRAAYNLIIYNELRE